MLQSHSPRLLAAVYDDGIAADNYLSGLAYDLRDEGIAVHGIVQRNTFRRDRAKCDMELEELGSGLVFQLSKDRGKLAGGCRLDREALSLAAMVLADGIRSDCELLIINKFGRSETEGRGLRDVVACAFERNLPTLVGLPRKNIASWREFSGDYGKECDIGNFDFMEWARLNVRSRNRETGDLLFA